MSALEEVPSAKASTDIVPDQQARRRRPGFVWAFIGAVVIALGFGAWLWASDSPTEATPAATGPAATATVERGTIAPTESWDGTLEYAAPLTVTSGVEGTVTRLPSQGQKLERGDELVRVNERPVIVLYGRVPMYRDLSLGATGVDVKQLERNLAALGYDSLAVDNEYTSSTAAAVREWQQDHALPATGVAARGDVVFFQGVRQVDVLRVNVGDHVVPGAPLFDVTGTDQIVRVQADIDDRDVFDVDAEVTVVLPGGREVRGRVDTLTAAEVAPADGGGATQAESVLDVEIALRQEAAGNLVGASVDVVVSIEERRNVLLVPVNALLALVEGGYGLEVLNDDGTTSLVAVDTGLFGDGKVEVTGDRITEGTVVGVAGR